MGRKDKSIRIFDCSVEEVEKPPGKGTKAAGSVTPIGFAFPGVTDRLCKTRGSFKKCPCPQLPHIVLLLFCEILELRVDVIALQRNSCVRCTCVHIHTYMYTYAALLLVMRNARSLIEKGDH